MTIAAITNADEQTKQRFLIQYARESKILRDRWANCSGNYVIVSPEGKKVAAGFDARFVRSNSLEKVELRGEIPAQKEPVKLTTVEKVGDDGSYFMLVRNGKDAKFQARAIQADERTLNLYEQKAGRIIRANLGGVRKPLITMIEEKTAELIDANQVAGEKNMIEASFKVNNGSRVSQLVVRFDIANHWSVVQQAMFVGAPAKNTTTYTVEYDAKINGIAMPRKVTLSENKNPYILSDWKFGPTPSEAFSMQAYGLSDAAAKKPEAPASQVIQSEIKSEVKGTNYFAAVAIGLAVVGLFFFLLFKAWRPFLKGLRRIR